MPGKVTKSVRLPADEAEYIETVAEENDVTETEVLRQRLRDGIRYRELLQDIPQIVDDHERRLRMLENKRVRRQQTAQQRR